MSEDSIVEKYSLVAYMLTLALALTFDNIFLASIAYLMTVFVFIVFMISILSYAMMAHSVLVKNHPRLPASNESNTPSYIIWAICYVLLFQFGWHTLFREVLAANSILLIMRIVFDRRVLQTS